MATTKSTTTKTTPAKPTVAKAAPAPKAEEVPDFDTLVSSDPHPTAEQLELEELRAELARVKEEQAQSERARAVERPVPEAELSPEQKQIRELQDQLAKANGRSQGTLEYEENTEGGIIVHFLSQQTFSSNNKAFYYGQEVTFGPEAYKDTVDRYGNSWLNMTEEEQIERWDEVKFRKGPWPGKRVYEDPALANVTVTTQAPVVNV